MQTKRGFHLYFAHPGGTVQNAIRVEGRYDVRGDGGYVLAPPSVHSAGEYEWKLPLTGIPVTTLGLFDRAWRPESKMSDAETKAIADGVAYIATITAISGQRGHDDTYRAACCLRAAGMGEAEALLALQDWNKTNAQPPWSDRDLLHKIQDAYR